MKIFKNIKDRKLYTINLLNGVYVAIPLDKDGVVISNCSINEFVPVSSSK
jgi:hypothetical protein